jgi:alpha-glucosidase
VNEPTTDWWRNAVVYQIYPRSFADSTGDGMGDLPGITARLHALADLGVDAVWLSPFYRSPQADAGYDVADYRDVDPLFGTLADFDALLARAHDLGIRVIIDLVPNHSSDEHPWFEAALASPPGSPERARYLFRDGGGQNGELPPNNWKAIFGGPAWDRITESDGSPGQWYLHLFDPKQPDWDWTNPQVRDEFVDVLRFWLDRGVDGFRVDVAHSLVKADGLPDAAEGAGPLAAFGSPDGDLLVEVDHGRDDANGGDPGEDDPHGGEHRADDPGPMWDQDGVHEIYRAWRAVLDEYQPPRILVAEAWVDPAPRLARYVREDEMHQAFNFDFLVSGWHPGQVRRVIDESISANDAVGAPTTWVLSNHDVIRHTSRFGLSDPAARLPSGIGADDEQPDDALGLARARAATLFMLALPGSAFLYQGEELGLPEHTALDDHLRQDPTWMRSGFTQRGRDGCRVPLPWEAERPGLGFSPTGATWLPQPEAFVGKCRDVQIGDPRSTLTMYTAALRLRRELRLGDGALSWLEVDPAVLAFENSGVRVVANMGGAPVTLPDGEVFLASGPLSGDGTLPTDTAVWLR